MPSHSNALFGNIEFKHSVTGTVKCGGAPSPWNYEEECGIFEIIGLRNKFISWGISSVCKNF